MKRQMLITYISLGVVTLIAGASSIVWASQETNILEEQELSATLNLTDEVRNEYLEGQDFDTKGITFIYDGKEANIEDVLIEYDFNLSGTRVVKFSKTEGKKTYVARLPVTVYHISHLDVRNNNISKEGEKWDFSKLVIYAEVNGKPNSFKVPNSLYPSVIELKYGDYKLETKKTELNGKYIADITAGRFKYTIPYYDDSEFSSQRVLSLYNTAQSGEKLTLYIDSNSSDYTYPDENSDIEMNGTYVLIDNNGDRFCHSFYYHLKPGWSNEFNGSVTTSILGDGGLSAVINGITFTAPQKEWHDVVLGDPEAVERYLVTYNSNGGTGTMENVENVRGNFDLSQVEYLAPEGMAFKSWLVNGEEKRDCDVVKVYSNTEIKAVWAEIPNVDSNRILTLTNSSSTADKLTLYVETTDARDGFIWPDVITDIITVKGQYLFEKASGVKILYPFLYTLSTHWTSSFKSNSQNWRVADAQAGDDYTCTINGVEFRATAQDWHDAIIGKAGPLPTFTVSFDNNGGEGTMDDVQNIRGNYALPKCTFIAPQNKIFAGWLVDDVEYGCGDNVLILEDTTIKAIWGDIPEIDEARVLSFANDSGTSDTLTLYLESTTSSLPWISTFIDGNLDLVKGRYLFVDASGNKSFYPFTYSQNNGVHNFGDTTNYVYDRLDGDILKATIEGVNFSASSWREAIIGKDVTRDILEQEIANSNPRIAKMTPNEPEKNLDLYLVVLKTDNPDGFIWPKGGYEVNVTGKYVLVDRTNGDIIRVYNFKYHLDGGWASSLSSRDVNPDDYILSDEFRDGNVFTAVRLNPPSWEDWANFTLADADWKKAVLGNG